MSEKSGTPMTLKGLLAVVVAGILYLVAQVTGIDLTGGKKDAPAGTGTETSGQVETPRSDGRRAGPKSPAPEQGPTKKQPPVTRKDPAPDRTTPPPDPQPAQKAKRDDTAKIRQLFTAMRSDVIVEAEGEVVHILRDDTHGSQHQLFLLELSNGITLKISHNIDLAPRIPVEKRDTVRFHGEYEWNEKGGVVHWTHHDPAGRHEGGWLEHEGKRYE